MVAALLADLEVIFQLAGVEQLVAHGALGPQVFGEVAPSGPRSDLAPGIRALGVLSKRKIPGAAQQVSQSVTAPIASARVSGPHGVGVGCPLDVSAEC